jgi:hypothetical protein
MNEDRHFERMEDAREVEAMWRARSLDEHVYALTQKGSEFYPWSAKNIQEALGEASLPKMSELQEAAESHDWAEWGALSSGIVRDYWEGLARQSVT